MAALYQELWTGELLIHFRHEGDFLSRIPSANQFVNNDVIHLADMGADPEVLVNNTTYPIDVSQRTDEDIAISLDKFDTENTAITDDELYALPYDKPGSVIRQHREVLEEKTLEKSLHALCPSSHATNHPFVYTTGADNGDTVHRKRLTWPDVIKTKRRLDDLKVPKRNRELVLCNQHLEDLLLSDEKFRDQWYNLEAGKIMNRFGFNISECTYNPVIDSATEIKKAFGAASVPANELAVSVLFYAGRAVQARGSVKMYYRDSKIDPEYRRSVVGFRVYHICLPKKNLGFGALVSTPV